MGTSDLVRVLNDLQPDEWFWQTNPTFDFRAAKDTWGRVPHTFIRLADDKSMPLTAQDMYIREADALTPANPFDVHTASGGHGTFLAHPTEVATILSTLT